MKKPVIIILIIVAILAIILGIGFIKLNKEKTSMTASNFKSLMEQKGYTVLDANSQ